MVSNPRIEYKSEFSNLAYELDRKSAIFDIERIKMTTSQNGFIRISDLKNGGLGHVTINFDSVLRRLLFSTTQTNSTVPSLSSLRTQPYAKHWCTADRALENPRQR